MIFVLAGTQDGRELAEVLVEKCYHVMASVISQYGKSLFDESKFIINDHPLDQYELIQVIRKYNITLLVDASHPYATNVSQTAMDICQKLNICYIRYERENSILPLYDKLYLSKDYLMAIEMAADLGQNIFLTTGSRMLQVFTESSRLKTHTLIARVLPDEEVMKKCISLGFTPKHLIAMQGPFSHALNVELFKKYRANVIVSKESGKIGGTDTKITAAMELNLPIVLIERPKLKYALLTKTYDEVVQQIEEFLNQV